MTGLFRTTVVEINGVRTISGGGTNASNAGQALLNLSGVSITGNQTISGVKTFLSSINYGVPSGAVDFGLRTIISNISGDSVSFTRAGSVPTPHGYGIVFDGGDIGNKKGYLTVGGTTSPTSYSFASLDWVNRILSGQWKTNQKLLVNNTGVLLSGEAVVSNGTVNSMIKLTQAQYNALSPVDPTTFYVIIG
jgi:hypothetical protein